MQKQNVNRVGVNNMGKVGYWTYWYKAPDFDLNFTSNKKNIPKNQPYVQLFKVYTKNGMDYELIENGKVIWSHKNTHLLSECEKAKMGLLIQKILHKRLDTIFPYKEYKKRFEKHVKGCKIK
jgi:hypothetical protein